MALRRGPRDPVTPALRSTVLLRDRERVAAKLGFAHDCRDRFGRTHARWALDALTLEHVKDDLAMGKRAPSDVRHLVALCGFLNNQPPTKVMREAFRAYLAEHANA